MSAKMSFLIDGLLTILSFAFAAASFLILPLDFWVVTLMFVICGLMMAHLCYLSLKKISHGSGFTRQRPVRRN